MVELEDSDDEVDGFANVSLFKGGLHDRGGQSKGGKGKWKELGEVHGEYLDILRIVLLCLKSILQQAKRPTWLVIYA